MNKVSYLKGATILAAATLIVRIIGAVFRIPLQRIVGDSGIGLLHTVNTVYFFILTVAASGLSIALSKMVSSAHSLNRTRQIKKIFSTLFILFIAVGLLGAAAMVIFSGHISQLMTGSTQARASFVAISPAIFFICIAVVYRGYTQGLSIMTPVSVAQVSEAASRFIIVISIVLILMNRGYPMPIVIAGAFWGTSISTGIYFLCYIFYRRKLRQTVSLNEDVNEVAPDTRRFILKQLFKIGLPITICASIINLLNLTTAAFANNRLQTALGISFLEARVLLGTYANTHNLFNIPSTFMLPLTASLIPVIVAFRTHNDDASAVVQVESGLKIANIIALAAGVGLTVLASPIIRVVYPKTGAEAVMLMPIMGVASYFLCLVFITNGILQAYGLEKFTIISLAVGGAVKIALAWVLIGNPQVNIYGAAISMTTCFAISSALNLFFIANKIKKPPRFMPAFAKPLLCAISMGGVAFAMYSGVYWLWPSPLLALISAVLPAALIYLSLIVVTGAITYEDMQMLPKGEKLAKILRIREKM